MVEYNLLRETNYELFLNFRHFTFIVDVFGKGAYTSLQREIPKLANMTPPKSSQLADGA